MEYEKKSLADLKILAKERGIKKISAMKKQELIEALIKSEKDSDAKSESNSETGNTADNTVDNNSEKAEKKVAEKEPDKVIAENKGDAVAKQNKRLKYVDNMVKKQQINKQGMQREQIKDRTKENVTKEYNATEQQNVRDNSVDYRTRSVQKQDYTNHNASSEDITQLDSGEVKSGILEVMSDGYGFIRCDNFLPGEQDVYVSPAFIRRFGLRTGDIIVGNTKIKSGNEKFSALLYMKSVNGYPISVLSRRKRFEDLTPIFPNERIHLETAGTGVAMRMVDLISPIGKGQRGMIVSQPKTGKTTLLKQVAKAVTKNHPDMHLIILLIDERPEEVTDIKESIEGNNVEVIYSTFDELPDNHRRVSEMVIERAKRLVEHGRDVMVLLDSITRLARAYNLTCQPSGRTLSGGLDPAALHMPKKFFGAARNMREGGSLTILATALVDTGSRMDDVVFEEFKGTGNMELVLDRSLSEKRIFPAIDLPKSSTRRDDLLLDRNEMEASMLMRRAMNSSKSDEAVEQIINMFVRTKNNAEFIEMIKKVKIVH